MNLPINQILTGDCLEILKTFPDKCVDLVLTDPPYGIDFGSEKESMSAGLRIDGTRRKYNEWSNPIPKKYEKWDDKKPTRAIFNEILRISKHQVIWGGNYFTDYLIPSGGWLIWDKGVVMPTLSKCEMAWTNGMAHTEIYHYLWAGFRKERPEERYHTTQKPVEVMQWCLTFFPNSKLILDPFLGSGTTAVAAKMEGRNYIGIEISPKYVEIAKQRVSSAPSPLFI